MALEATNSFSPSSSYASSSFQYSWAYDVFISFRGSDTRYGFTGNLHKSLTDKGIHAFIDDEELRKGEEITPSLVKAIQESRIAIIVFSKNYASSSFCLDELATIMECVKGKGRLVLPVFYGVEPSEIRHQRNSYGEAMAKHEKRCKLEKLQKWRHALTQAASLSGEHVKIGSNYEYVFIHKIVKDTSTKINRKPLYVANYPVGLKPQVQKVYSLLNDEFEGEGGVLMVGIHGIGGIGKSTLARSLYNLIADQFDGLCFLENVREESEKHGLVHLQKTLLSELLHEDIKLAGVHRGMSFIKERLCEKKVLLVLDDINKLEQLQKLAGGNDWFGSGSKVIIITRDKQLLISHGITRTYEVEGLSEKDALALLTQNAFKREIADPSYMDVLKRAATYACGLPLALEVIGSNLCGQSIDVWRSRLDQYERIPNADIQMILQISYDALEEDPKKIFLDICSLNQFNYLEIKEILQARHDNRLINGLNVLVQKSLIKMKYGFLKLHDMILDMGKEIIHQESREHPGDRSRLWLFDDVIHVLKENDGSRNIQMMILDGPKFGKVEVEWDGDAFKKMKSLEVLIIKNVCFSQSPKHLPNSLRVLEWWNYPSNSLPYDFHPNKLAIFELPCSKLLSVRFVEKQKLMNLKVLRLDESNIKQIPDVSNVPNLEVLSFKNCLNLIEVDKSVGLILNKLSELGVSGCSKLRTFPPLKLPCLRCLDFTGCSSLENFPETSRDMKSLRKVFLDNTSIEKLPFSFKNLRNLCELYIRNRHGKLQLHSSIATFPYLETAHVSGFERLEFIEEEEDGYKNVLFTNCNMDCESVAKFLSRFRYVDFLDLSESNITFLPESIKELCSLRILIVNNCKKLEEIRGIPQNIKEFYAGNCKSLNHSSRSMLLDKKLHSSGKKVLFLPERSIPEWFERRRKETITFWFRNKLPPFSLCVRGFNFLYAYINGEKIANNDWDLFEFYGDIYWPIDDAEHITIYDIEISDSKLLSKNNEWNRVDCSVEYMEDDSFIKKLIGIHIHKDEVHIKDMRFTDPSVQGRTHRGDDYDAWMCDDKKWLSLRPCWEEPLDCAKNLELNLMQLASASDTFRDQDLSKDKGKDIMPYNDSSEQNNMQSCDDEQELPESNWKSNSMKLVSTNDTIQEGSCHDLDYDTCYYEGCEEPSRKRIRNTLPLDFNDSIPEKRLKLNNEVNSEVYSDSIDYNRVINSNIEIYHLYQSTARDDKKQLPSTKLHGVVDVKDITLDESHQTHLRSLSGGGEPLQEPPTQTEATPAPEVLFSDSTMRESEKNIDETHAKPVEEEESESDDDDADLSFMLYIKKALPKNNTKLKNSSATESDIQSQPPQVPSLPQETQINTPKKDSTWSEPDLPRVKLNKVLSVLNNPLDSLGEDGDKQRMLLEAVAELGEGPKSANVDQIFQKLEGFVGDIIETTSRISQLEMDQKGQKDKLNTLEKDMMKSRKTKTKIEDAIRDRSLCQAKLEDEINSLKAQLYELEKEKVSLDEAVAKGNKELRRMDLKCGLLQQDKEKLSQEYNDLNTKLGQAQDTRSKLIDNQNHLRASIMKILG